MTDRQKKLSTYNFLKYRRLTQQDQCLEQKTKDCYLDITANVSESNTVRVTLEILSPMGDILENLNQIKINTKGALIIRESSYKKELENKIEESK